MKIFLLSFIAIIFIFSLANIAFGAGSDLVCKESETPNQPYPWCDVTRLDTSSGLIAKIYEYSLALVGVVALGTIIYGGIKYTISAGNPSSQSEATQYITGAIWGLVLLLGAVLLFDTINPEIVSLKLQGLKKIKINNQNAVSKTEQELCSKFFGKDFIPCSKNDSDCKQSTPENGPNGSAIYCKSSGNVLPEKPTINPTGAKQSICSNYRMASSCPTDSCSWKNNICQPK